MMRQLIFINSTAFNTSAVFGLDGILYAGPVADVGSAVIVACFIVPEMKN